MNNSNIQLQNSKINQRIATYNAVATELELLSDYRIVELLENATPIGTSIGGTSALLEISGKKIFVKKIRLTDIERQPENRMSTRNIFELPLYYQYGIGSAGFGVWRELATHTMTTNWVLANECQNFPLMYHWRLLSRPIQESPTADQLTELEHDVEYWGGSPVIRTRLLANLNASADIVLFLEYFPENLHTWLRKKICENNESAESACKMVEINLKKINSFINSHGLLHFDVHFNNILTDGNDLYFADFGLAISNQFELSEAESDFFKKNYNYDQCYSMAYMVEWLLTQLFKTENWAIGNYNAILHDYVTGKGKPLPSYMEAIITRYKPLAVVMNEFFRKLKESKTTLYPASELELVCTTGKYFLND